MEVSTITIEDFNGNRYEQDVTFFTHKGRDIMIVPKWAKAGLQHSDVKIYPDKYRGKFGFSKEEAIATHGYAITAHKSQGSEWDKVYVDYDMSGERGNDPRWLYTAVTRAKNKAIIHAKQGVKSKSWEEIGSIIGIDQIPAVKPEVKKKVKAPEIKPEAIKSPVTKAINDVESNPVKLVDETIAEDSEDQVEVREGLADVTSAENYKNHNALDSKVQKALGIVMSKKALKEWYDTAENGDYENALDWVKSTIQEFTKTDEYPDGIQYSALPQETREALKQQYYSILNFNPTNQKNIKDNGTTNGYIQFTTEGKPILKIHKTHKPAVDGKKKKVNPKITRSLSVNPGADFVWVSLRDVYQLIEDPEDPTILKNTSQYEPLSARQLQDIDETLIAQGTYVLAFPRGESKVAFAPINSEHLQSCCD